MKLKNLISFLKSKLGFLFKNKKTILILLLIILVLIVFAMPSGKSKTDDSSNRNNLGSLVSVKYESELEYKITKMLLAIKEIDSATVMVVCDESERVEYLKNTSETVSGSGESSSTTKIEDVAYEKNGSNSTPIVIATHMPKIVGVWIVVNHVSASTKLSILKSVSSVLNIEESSISILQE